MPEIFFLFSNWYSGATLLSMILNNHPQITCNGETFPFEYDYLNKKVYVCSCGKHRLECDFYSKVSESFKGKETTWNDSFRIFPKISKINKINQLCASFNKYVWLRDFVLYFNPYHKIMINYLQAHMEFYERSLLWSGASCYVDGTKRVRRAELFVKYLGIKTKIIYLIRDGRGFCWSYLKNNKLTVKDLPVAAQRWQEYIRQVDNFSKRYPEIEIKVIRYEDLCHDMAETLRKLCSFLGYTFSTNLICPPVNHHIFGNRMRSTFDGNIREDLSWKYKFSANELSVIDTIIGENLNRFGYV